MPSPALAPASSPVDVFDEPEERKSLIDALVHKSECYCAVLQLLAHRTVWCLGLTRGGQPRHPLYVPARTPLQIYRRPRHDWTDWQPISDPGVDEQLHERFCPTCGADQISVDELTGDRR